MNAHTELWRIVLPAFIPALLTHVAFVGGRVVVAIGLARAEASGFTVGAVIGLYALVPALGSVAMGRLIDRQGAARSVRQGVCVALAGSILAAAFAPVWVLAIAVAVIGGGNSLAFLAQQQVIAREVPPERRTDFLSTTGVAFSATHFLGPLAAGLSIDHLGIRAAYWVMAIPVACALLALPFLRASTPAVARPEGIGRRNALDLLLDPRIRPVLVLSALVLACWEAHVILLPLYGSQIGLSATAIGTIFATFSAGIVVARVLLAWAARRFGAWRVMAGSLALSCIGFVLYPLTTVALLLGACAFCLGLAAGINQPLTSSLLMDYAPEGRTAEALGLRNAIASAEQLTVPVAFGALAGGLGTAPMFWAAALVALAGSLHGFRMRRPRKSGP